MERTHQKRSAETRAKLIEAGVEIFSARGFEGATTRAIALRAGVALASLPYHFKTKEALWKAVVDDIFGRFTETMASARSGIGDLEEREQTRRMLAAYVSFSAESPELLRIVMQEGTAGNERSEWLVEKHLRPNFEYVKSETRRAVRNGYGRSGRLEHIYYMMVGAAGLPYVVGPEFQLLTKLDPFDPEMIEAHVDSVLDLFYPSISVDSD
ncbi:MAG: TetR/AcrR family transcriptional regulator [Myxococcota bacterium]|nr:TetR/AcrR family transcriptional regulator [Myxococcota bacterium]